MAESVRIHAKQNSDIVTLQANTPLICLWAESWILPNLRSEAEDIGGGAVVQVSESVGLPLWIL